MLLSTLYGNRLGRLRAVNSLSTQLLGWEIFGSCLYDFMLYLLMTDHLHVSQLLSLHKKWICVVPVLVGTYIILKHLRGTSILVNPCLYLPPLSCPLVLGFPEVSVVRYSPSFEVMFRPLGQLSILPREKTKKWYLFSKFKTKNVFGEPLLFLPTNVSSLMCQGEIRPQDHSASWGSAFPWTNDFFKSLK